MAEAFIRQAILHGVAAAVIVEALLAAWRIRSADARLRFWLVAIAVPFVLLPAFFFAAPYRLDEHFVGTRALFASVRWNAVRVAAVPADRAAFVLLAAIGTALLLRDLLPLLVARRERAGSRTPRGTEPAANGEAIARSEQLAGLVRRQAADLGVDAPTVEVLAHDAPILFVRGTGTHTLVVSSGLLDRLSSEEVAAALAHELAHVRFRDPLLGWLLMLARLLMFWNPAVQLVARAIVQETEHRADAVAAHAAGTDAYRTAFRVLMAIDDRALPPGGSAWDRLLVRVHRHHVEARAATLLAARSEPTLVGMKLLACAGLFAGLLFFVV